MGSPFLCGSALNWDLSLPSPAEKAKENDKSKFEIADAHYTLRAPAFI